jgi:hypothetical protein
LLISVFTEVVLEDDMVRDPFSTGGVARGSALRDLGGKGRSLGGERAEQPGDRLRDGD